jgi:hypothetical protein
MQLLQHKHVYYFIINNDNSKHAPKPCDRSHSAATVTLAIDRKLTCIAMSEIAVYQAVIQYRANTYQLGART